MKLLIRGLSVGYEPWKTLVQYRVSQTRQTRRGKWPSHANWVMNSPALVKQGSAMWQGVMKAWGTIQSGLEQQDPTNWSEIIRQPLFGNRFLTNDLGVQWGTDPKTNIRTWVEKGFKSLKDIATEDGYGWKSYPELLRFRNSTRAP